MNKSTLETAAAGRADPSVGSARSPTAWTPERVARALRLYLEEDFTAAEVADALGADISRAAVTGKIRRLGFLKRQSRGAAGLPPRKARVVRQRVERRLPPQRPPQALPPLREVAACGVPTTLAGLAAHACRWPIDDPGAGRMHLALFCAGPATRGAYCAAHWALAHDRSPSPAAPEPQPQSVSTPLDRAA